MSSKDKLINEFDEIANKLERKRADLINQSIPRVLIKKVPKHCEYLLDVGCGVGSFARAIAPRCTHVLGMDISPEMIRVASNLSAKYSNIAYEAADAMEYDFPADYYDCVVFVMALHHLPLNLMLEKIKHTLKPGGVLLVYDKIEQSGVMYSMMSILYQTFKWLKKIVRKNISGGRAQKSHWKHDPEEASPSLEDINSACNSLLPGAEIKNYLGRSRYAMAWVKPK